MSDHQDRVQSESLSFVTIAGSILSVLFLLVASYPPLALAALVAVFFAVYVWLRVMIFLENDRFTPKRLRVGMTWALVGIHDDTGEFDPRPVRVYFILLAILFVGLVVRPLVDWIWL